MHMITQAKLDELNALSCDTLEIKATAHQITMRLATVVAITNFKTLAAAGRAGNGASFNGSTKTLTLPLIPKAEFIPGKMALSGGERIPVYRVRGMILEINADTMEQAIAGCPRALAWNYRWRSGLVARKQKPTHQLLKRHGSARHQKNRIHRLPHRSIWICRFGIR